MDVSLPAVQQPFECIFPHFTEWLNGLFCKLTSSFLALSHHNGVISVKVRVTFSRCCPYSQSLNQCLAHGGDSADAVFVRESNTVPNSQQTKQCTHARLTWVHTPYSVPGHHRPLPRSGTCPSKTCSHLVPLGSFPGFFYTLEGQNWNKIRQCRKKLELKVTMLRWSLKLKTIPSDAERYTE